MSRRTRYLLAALAWGTSLCVGAIASGQGDPRPLVGVLVPLSGDHQALGERTRAMVNLAWTSHQAVGVRFYDTQDDGPTAALDLALEDGVVAVLGPIGDVESELVAEHAEDIGMPTFTLSGDGVEDNRRWVSRLRTTPLEQARALGAVVHTLGELDNIAILAPDDAYGDAGVLGFIGGTTASGARVSRIVRYEAGERDITDAMRELIGRRTTRLDVPSDPWSSPARASLERERGDRSRPDAIFIPDYADQVASVLPFLEFQGWLTQRVDTDVQLLGLSGWAGYELTFADGLAAGAVIVQVFHHDDNTSDARGWADEAAVVLGDQPLEYDAQVYDAAGFVFSTVATLSRDARSGEAVLQALDRMPAYEGVCGTMWLDVQGAVVRDVGMWEVDGAGYAFPIATIHPPSP